MLALERIMHRASASLQGLYIPYWALPVVLDRADFVKEPRVPSPFAETSQLLASPERVWRRPIGRPSAFRTHRDEYKPQFDVIFLYDVSVSVPIKLLCDI